MSIVCDRNCLNVTVADCSMVISLSHYAPQMMRGHPSPSQIFFLEPPWANRLWRTSVAVVFSELVFSSLLQCLLRCLLEDLRTSLTNQHTKCMRASTPRNNFQPFRETTAWFYGFMEFHKIWKWRERETVSPSCHICRPAHRAVHQAGRWVWPKGQLCWQHLRVTIVGT